MEDKYDRRGRARLVATAGLALAAWETGLLAAARVLRQAPGQPGEALLSEPATQLYMRIAAAGDEGLSRTRIPKTLRAGLDALVLELELTHLAQWSRDASGRFTHLRLTWQGEEALARAREANHAQGSGRAARGRRLSLAAR
jgi:hypothetical protein